MRLMLRWFVGKSAGNRGLFGGLEESVRTICTKFCHRAVDALHLIENTWVAGGEF